MKFGLLLCGSLPIPLRCTLGVADRSPDSKSTGYSYQLRTNVEVIGLLVTSTAKRGDV